MQKTQRRWGVLISLAALIALGALTTAAQEPNVIAYELGEMTIVQERFAEDSRFRNMQVLLQGVLAMPEGEGPFPVALILHGSYTFCTAPLANDVDPYPCPPEDDLRQYMGFSYLAAALAARGYIAIVPDYAAEFNNGFAEPLIGERFVQIVNAHLEALAAGEGFGAELVDRVDLSRLVITSHSRGGGYGVLYATSPEAAYTVDALAMIMPASVVVDSVIPETLPVALVIGTCDGDVGTELPLQFAQQLPPLRPALATIFTLAKGTHNASSTQLGPDPREVCEASDILDPQAQRDLLAQLVPDFFDMALAYGTLAGE